MAFDYQKIGRYLNRFLAFVWIATVVAVVVMMQMESWDQQKRNFTSAKVVVGVVLLSVLVIACYPRRAFRRKWQVLAGVGGLFLVTPLVFRIQGVTGDLVPIVVFRWAEDASQSSVKNLQPGDASTDAEASFSQFMGPTRDGRVSLPDVPDEIASVEASLVWRRAMGAAWSGFAIQGDRAVTMEQDGETERVIAVSVTTGEVLWEHGFTARYATTIGGEGPRTTPTIEGGFVYAAGGTGELYCLDLENGSEVWRRNILKDASAEIRDWGVAGSPLLFGEQLIAVPGGTDAHSVISYNRTDGEILWHAGDDEASYSSPVVATLSGVEQVLVFSYDGLYAYDPMGECVLWSHPWPTTHPHVALPLAIGGDRVLISSGYGTGCALLKPTVNEDGKWEVEQVWKSRALKAKFNNTVLKDGHVYGLDDGIMVCVDLENGKRVWKEGRYGHGQQLLINNHLMILQAESGKVVFLKPTPEGPNVLSEISALEGKSWNPPALAGRYLVVRNHQEAACFRLEFKPATEMRGEIAGSLSQDASVVR